jgi:ferredoxin-type protein NapH
MKVERFEIARAAISLFLILFLLIASINGILHGTSSALTTGDFKIISPLDWILLTLGTKSLFLSLSIPALIAIAIIAIFGRFFCGWICPVGIFLDLSHKITVKNNEKIMIQRRNYEKYIILLTVLIASIAFNFSMPYLFSPPGILYRAVIYYVLMGIIGADLVLFAFVFIFDILAIRYGRTWCNTICPLGTLISSLSIINLVKPKIDKRKCTKCFVCERLCPMGIPLTNVKKWGMMPCTKCLKCFENCPVKAIRINII